jgi:hypothetical protein
MFALSAEQNISDRLKRMDLTVDNFSALSREFGNYVSGPRLSQALRGAKNLENKTALFLMNLLTDLEHLIDASFPLPLSLKNPQVLARLMRDMKDTPSDTPSLQDFILLSSILSGQDLKEIADGRHITLAELREKISEVSITGGRAFLRVAEIVEGKLDASNEPGR